ncbi:MAG: TatD DNase family protein [Hyphomonadaceae bacterium]|nr:MAG: TatD DNase family protein [Hyphomonadaceae bacterium]KAF0185355.1 MAG: TatD DNase family protein [Hyphomonadaceae bacterium]
MIDTHVNLHHHLYHDDLPDVLARAKAGGIHGMLSICDRIENFEKILEIVTTLDNFWLSVGAHPHEAKDHLDLSVEKLTQYCTHEEVIGIGETGLDFHYGLSPEQDQIQVLLTHIHAAQASQLPLIVHTRSADAIMGDILTSEYRNMAFPLLMHCYTSGENLLKKCLDIGAYVSISGIATFRNADDVRNNIKYIPHDKLLVETDCPYLAPIPKRGQRNEPLFLNYLVEYLAQYLERDIEELKAELDNNFFSLFTRARCEPSK